MNMDLNKVEIVESFNSTDWGLKTINAPRVWDKTKGEGVKVMVIDTGVDMKHEDIKYIYGFDAINRTIDINDNFGHGTHVVGLIAGKNTGVAPNVELYIIKALDDKGNGTIGNVMDGITSAINMDVDILCMSLGTYGIPVILQQRIIQAYESGITIVSAVGNDGHHTPQYPAIMKEVIGVGGVDKKLEVTKFSNDGWDVLAPSVEVLSTYIDGKYARMSGTSMAVPLVAGAIALLISYNRKKGVELTPTEIKSKIGNSIIDLTKLLD